MPPLATEQGGTALQNLTLSSKRLFSSPKPYRADITSEWRLDTATNNDILVLSSVYPDVVTNVVTKHYPRIHYERTNAVTDWGSQDIITYQFNATGATVTSAATWQWNWGSPYVSVSLDEEIRNPFRNKSRTTRKHRGGWRSDFSAAEPNELVALQLLRTLVGQNEFKRYLRDGFVTVQGSSGLLYQIKRHDRIAVWRRGQRVASLCVHLADRDAPPTDEVIAKILMVECDEQDIWQKSNVWWVGQLCTHQQDPDFLTKIAFTA